MPELRKSNRRGFFPVVAAAALLWSTGLATAGEVTIAGTTRAAFGNAIPSPVSSLFNLDFYGSAFAVATTNGVAIINRAGVPAFPNVNNFGAIRLGLSGVAIAETSFTLALTFNTPGDIPGGQTDVFHGVIAESNGRMRLHFDDPQRTYFFDNDFQTGSMILELFDVTLAPGKTSTLTGAIRAGSSVRHDLPPEGTLGAMEYETPEPAYWASGVLPFIYLALRHRRLK